MKLRSTNLTRLSLTIIFFGCTLGAFFLYSRAKPSPTREQLMQKVYDYPMHWIKERCKKDHSYSDEDVVILEKELKRYLLMCMLKETKGIPLGMYSKHVDDLWHSFILFTKEYQNFCLSTGGDFIHHRPEVDKEREDRERKPEEWVQKHKEYRAFIEMYEKTFGEEIHPIWLLDGVEKAEGNA